MQAVVYDVIFFLLFCLFCNLNRNNFKKNIDFIIHQTNANKPKICRTSLRLFFVSNEQRKCKISKRCHYIIVKAFIERPGILFDRKLRYGTTYHVLEGDRPVLYVPLAIHTSILVGKNMENMLATGGTYMYGLFSYFDLSTLSLQQALEVYSCTVKVCCVATHTILSLKFIG